MDERRFVVAVDQAGERLDRYLTAMLPEISRSQIQRLIKDGAVLVDGGATRANYRVSAEDQVTVRRRSFPRPDPSRCR
jgi:23S rRNA pseudouridine1911/1915/1917 synthase